MTRRSSLLSASFAVAALAVLSIAGLSAAPAVAAEPGVISTASCTPGSGVDLAGKTPTIDQLTSVDLICADLRGAHLDGLDLGQLRLSGADLKGATLKGTSLIQANLDHADLTSAVLTSANLGQAELKGATLTGIHAAHAEFSQDDLTGLSLVGADLRGADFTQATLKNADLRNADLTNATLVQADLSGATLKGATITGASLDQADTSGTSIDGGTGAFPLDAYTALLTFILALIVFVPRMRRSPGRAAAWLGLLVVAAGAVAELSSAIGWSPNTDALFVLPLLTPIVFIALYVGASLHRPRGGWAAAGLSLVALFGFFAFIGAGLAFLGDSLFGIMPFAQQCTTATCLGGATRGWIGIVLGLVLMLAACIVARVKSLAPPPPDYSRYFAMSGGQAPTGSAQPPAAGQGVPPSYPTARSADRGPDDEHRPPVQVI